MAPRRTTLDDDEAAGPEPGRRFPFLPALGGADLDVEGAARRVFASHLGEPEGARFWQTWLGTLRVLRPLGKVSHGNGIRVLGDADQAFEAMWAAIDGARTRVLLNTFSLDPDAVGLRTLAALTRAAERGCRVVFVFDSVGSRRLGQRHLDELRAAGAEVHEFNPLSRLGARFSMVMRNHRKILVADDLGFCGGRNISEDYAGERLGNGRFRDMQLELRGPSVAGLAEFVLHLANMLSRKGPRRVPPVEPLPDGSLVQLLDSNVRRHRRAIQKALRVTTGRCVRRCFLTSPYFVPPPSLLRRLVVAAGRGVDVRVLTAGPSDVPLSRFAGRHLYPRLLRAGVRIFELEEQTLHAKIAVVDGVYAMVGSFNLDSWSFRRNLELNVSLLDREVAEELERQFERDLAGSSEVLLEDCERRPLWERVLNWCAYRLSRI